MTGTTPQLHRQLEVERQSSRMTSWTLPLVLTLADPSGLPPLLVELMGELHSHDKSPVADPKQPHSIRPCHGYLSLEGVVPQAGSMETPGIFARDPSVFTTVSRYWYGNEGLREGPFSMPSTITRLVDYTATPAATEIIDKFLDQMGQALSMNIAYVNLTDTWANTSDVSESVNDYMLDVSLHEVRGGDKCRLTPDVARFLAP